MQIENGKVVTIDYTLKDDQGNVIDSSEGGEALSYLHGAGNIIPGLEKALEGRTTGDELDVSLTAEEGYGPRDSALIQKVARDRFQSNDEIQVGMQFHTQSKNGSPIVVTVVEVGDEEITVDGNHPLAGENLNFQVKVVGVRDATSEELNHGHVHGPEGHN